MKILLKIAAFCGIMALAVSCASNKSETESYVSSDSDNVYVVEEEADEVEEVVEADETEIIISSDEDSYEDEDAYESEEVNQNKKTKKSVLNNPLSGFNTLGNKQDYVQYGNSSVFTKEFTGFKEQKLVSIIRTDNFMTGWGSINGGIYFYIQFDDEARKTLLNNINLYLSDFENKKLNSKGKNTDKIYGRVSYRLDWGTLNSSTPNYGSGIGTCGYVFLKNIPYFVIGNYPFKNEYHEVAGEATDRESKKIMYYFTRSQLRKLAELLSDETIKEALLDVPTYVETPAELDEY